jgi:mercuric ion transport protein
LWRRLSEAQAVSERRWLRIGIGGTTVTAVCCFTPALAVVLGAIGLSAWLAWLDQVLLPALVLFLGITAWALMRRHHR